MSMRKWSHSQWISLLLIQMFLTIVTTSNNNISNDCPLSCQCETIHRKHELHYHVKCNNMSGINEIDKMMNVNSLDLSNVGLLKISQPLDKLKNLTELNLSNNLLNDFSSRLGNRITILNLSHNRIKSEKLIMLPINLKTLDLSYNKITYLSRDLMNLKNLEILNITANPINCSCETLEVRNWLQHNKQIIFDKEIKCAYPKKSYMISLIDMDIKDVCDNYITSDETIDNNDIMLGDSPLNDDYGSGETEELDKIFMPVSTQRNNIKSNLQDLTAITEGSGDDYDDDYSTITTTDDISLTNTEQEESGSGGIIKELITTDITDDDDIVETQTMETTTETLEYETDEDFIDEPFVTGLGIYHVGNVPGETTTMDTTETENILEDTDTPFISQAKLPTDNVGTMQNSTNANVNQASTDNSMATYILLIVFGGIILALIVFVAFKNSKKNKRQNNLPKTIDLERQNGTELSSMNKNHMVGKPVEHIPLMEKHEQSNTEQPKPLNGNVISNEPVQHVPENLDKSPLLQSENQPKDDDDDEEHKQPSYPTIDNVDSVAKEPSHQQDNEPEPETDKELLYKPHLSTFKDPALNNNNNNNNNNDDTDELINSRYSPVYSPTGRIKIKLMQTPKPKTPLLVTRSLSNAGNTIITPK